MLLFNASLQEYAETLHQNGDITEEELKDFYKNVRRAEWLIIAFVGVSITFGTGFIVALA